MGLSNDPYNPIDLSHILDYSLPTIWEYVQKKLEDYCWFYGKIYGNIWGYPLVIWYIAIENGYL
jgi:hypothetical protein